MENSSSSRSEQLKRPVWSEVLVVLAHHDVELFVFPYDALGDELLVLLLQLTQLRLQALQVEHSPVPQQPAGEWVHVVEGDAGQLPAWTHAGGKDSITNTEELETDQLECFCFMLLDTSGTAVWAGNTGLTGPHVSESCRYLKIFKSLLLWSGKFKLLTKFQ